MDGTTKDPGSLTRFRSVLVSTGYSKGKHQSQVRYNTIARPGDTHSAAVDAAVVVDSIRFAVVASILVPMTSAAVMTLNQNFFGGF